MPKKSAKNKTPLWWKRYPIVESRELKLQPRFAKPELAVGQYVLLIGKPDKVRKILEVRWHSHRHEFVYIVETSSQNFFDPYWFRDQLALQE
jgi:hypothetical protein